MIVPKVTQTTAAVALHYDELDAFYREIWGEHVHHGYWEHGNETPQQAVEALVDLMARSIQLEPGMSVCDIGCGYGGSAKRLAQRHQVSVTGVTVSAAQAAYAQKNLQGVTGATVQVQDWMSNSFDTGCFDRALSIESSEHMPNLQRFFDEAFRVLKPGGLFGIYAWLARTSPGQIETRHLLEPICREGRLYSMGEEGDYLRLAARSGFELVTFRDLSEQVSRTWTVCIKRVAAKVATDRRYAAFLLDARASNQIFALTMFRLAAAYRTGAMRYGLFVFRKPL